MIKIISDTPWYLFLLCICIGITYSLFLYFKEKRSEEIGKNLKRLLFILRSISVGLISILLLNIFIKHISNKTENPSIILAIDNSVSIVSSKDSTVIKNLINSSSEELKRSLQEKFNVKNIVFGERTRSSDTIDFSDKETDLSELINTVNNNFSGQNIGAMIVMSDGILNKGMNPVYLTEKLKFPIYSIALGDTTEKKDVMISKINHNQIAYLGNQFPAEVTINASKLKGKEVTVSVLKNNIKKGEQKISINSENFSSNLNFTLEADAPGIQKYQVVISSVEGDSNPFNNSQSFVVAVIDNREKILILYNAPHPDIAALSESIESMKNYELVKASSGNSQIPYRSFSMIIIHGYSAVNKKIIEECSSARVPYLIINPNDLNSLNDVKVNIAVNKFNDAEPSFNKSFGLFSLSDELKSMIKNYPALKTPFAQYNVTNGAQVCIQQKIGSVETDDPVLLFNDMNGLKSGIFIGDGLWKWRLRNYLESDNFNAFNELISKSIQFLAVKSDKSYFRVYTEKIINENENIEFNAELYNKSYELVNEPDVTMTLKNSDGKTFNYTFSKSGNAYKLNAGKFAPGEYSFEAKAKYNNEIMVKKGIIIIKPMLSEKINTVANHSMLHQISKNSGGKLFYLSQIKELEKEILNNEYIKPVTYSQTETNDIIDIKWLFFLVIALITAEWFLRKYNGMI